MRRVVHCLVWLGLVLSVRGQSDCPADACSSTDVALQEAGNNDATNHLYVGGMFDVKNKGPDPYECGTINVQGIVNMEAFFWALKKYSDVYSQVSVGGFGMDSCMRSERAIENVYGFETCRTKYSKVSPRNTVAFVGPATNEQAMDTAKLLKEMEVTQVSSGASSPALKQSEYSYFLRTVPSDAEEMYILAAVIKNQGIRYIQVIVEGSMYGENLATEFMDQIAARNVCAVQHMILRDDHNGTDIRKFLKESEVTRVVVILGGKESARKVLEAVNSDLSTQNKFYFVGTSRWGDDVSVIQGLDQRAITIRINTDAYENKDDVDDFWNEFFQMKPDTGSNQITADVNTHNPSFAQFWEEVFGCNLATGGCDTANQNIRNKMPNIVKDKMVPHTLIAVKAILRGVREVIRRDCVGEHLCSELLNRDRSRGRKLYEYILNATNTDGNKFFRADGNPSFMYEKYEILSVSNNNYTTVMNFAKNSSGNYIQLTNGPIGFGTSKCNQDPCLVCNEMPAVTEPPTTAVPTTPTNQLIIDNEQKFVDMFKDKYLGLWREEFLQQTFLLDQEFTGIWQRNQTRDPEDWKTRFEKGQDWIIALGVCAGLGIVCVLVFEIYILYKLMGTKIGKQWRTMWLGQLLLLGIFLAYLVCFAYLFTPTKATCGIIRFGVGVSYAMCFAVLLVKLMVLLTSKTSADSLIPGDVDSPNYLRGIYQFLMYLFIVGVQVVIAIQWLIMVPPDAVKVTSNNNEEVWICNHYTWSLATEDGWKDMSQFIRTNFENHIISLCYVMFLVLLTVIIAMKSHGIITNHRESVFIGISAGFSIPIFIAWGLVGGLNKHKEYAQEFGDASIAFGLLIVVTIILFAMFLPKVRQLVNMGVEGIYLEDDRDTYYAGSVVMAPPSYKSRPSSVVYLNGGNSYNEPVILGDPNAVHLKHPGSTYSAPVYVKRPESTIGHGSGKVLRMTGDLTGKHPRDNRRSTSEVNYGYDGSGYGTYKKSRSEAGGTMRRANSAADLGAL